MAGQKRAWRWPVRRFVVQDRSMEPTLLDGDGLLTSPWLRPRTGGTCVFPHPARPETWLVKRVSDIDADRTMWVSSDNDGSTLADSRTFGRLPIGDAQRVILRVPRRFM